jgi:hypothetical protein
MNIIVIPGHITERYADYKMEDERLCNIRQSIGFCLAHKCSGIPFESYMAVAQHNKDYLIKTVEYSQMNPDYFSIEFQTHSENNSGVEAIVSSYIDEHNEPTVQYVMANAMLDELKKTMGMATKGVKQVDTTRQSIIFNIDVVECLGNDYGLNEQLGACLCLGLIKKLGRV